MIVEAIRSVVEKKDLSVNEATAVMEEIMSGQATEAQIAAIITALRMKGETINEIVSFAKVMRSHATKIQPGATELLDTCGTGGDVSHTFNISTATAFVAAGAGAKIAKHGNRSVSSHCGSADVMEALGIKIELEPKQVEACIDNVGIGFLFAPLLHKAMKYAIGPRRQIGIRTVFNILGPLTNPANATAQVLGVFNPDLTTVMAEVLRGLGIKHALVVHGADGLDELSITGDNKISELAHGEVKEYTLSPQQYGLPLATLNDLKGGTSEENAQIIRAILSGEKGAKRDIVLLNSAAALIAADKAQDFGQGITLAAQSIDSGNAMKKLEQFVEFSNKVK